MIFPYPDNECEGCKQGKKLQEAPYSSIVGKGAIHLPEGWVCTKYLNSVQYAAYKKLEESRKQSGK